MTYSDFDYHFSFKYPPDWQVTTPDEHSWQVVNNTSTITIVIAPGVTRPQTTTDLLLTGSGPEYELLKTTITFIK